MNEALSDATSSAVRGALVPQKLRIAFFVHYFPQLSEAFIISQAAALIAAGHEVDVIALWGVHAVSAEAFPVAARAGLLGRTLTPGFTRRPIPRVLGAARRALGSFSGRPAVLARALNPLAHGKWALNLRLLYEAAMFDPRNPYDVVHCQFADLAPHVLRLRRIGAFSAPVIVHLRGIDITRRPREFGHAVFHRIFAEADLMLANCEHFRGKAIALGCPPEKIDVYRSAIDLEAFAFRGPRPPDGGPLRLALIGRLVEKKGIVYAVRAVAALKARGIAATLEVLGHGPLHDALRAESAALGVDEQITWLGSGSYDQVIALLLRSDLLLAPSVTAADGDEDAPVNTLKEAMAIGLPVIGSRHGGIPELIEDGINGMLVPERDAAAIADAVATLLARRDRWLEIGRAGRARIERDYDIRNSTKRLVAIERQLIANRAGVSTT